MEKEERMLVKDLMSVLENLDESTEVAVDVVFPGLEGWTVRDYACVWSIDEESGGPIIIAEVHGADFDDPAIVAKIEEAATKMRG